MQLEQKTIDSVRGYWRSLDVSKKHDYMVVLYRLLLNRHAEYKTLFHTDMESMRNNMAASMDYVINNLDQQNKLSLEFRRLAKKHKQLEVSSAMFDEMVHCQLQAQQHVSGDLLTDVDRHHWETLVNYLARQILQAYPHD